MDGPGGPGGPGPLPAQAGAAPRYGPYEPSQRRVSMHQQVIAGPGSWGPTA